MSASQLVWLRNDLRLDDNPAIAQAQQLGDIQVLFIATAKQWRQHDESDAKLGLKAASINDICQNLAKKGIAFTLIEVDYFADVADALLAFCQQNKIEAVWFQQETALDESRRDEQVSQTLLENHIECHALESDLLVPVPVLTQKEEPYKVFTPYYRSWRTLLEDRARPPYDEPAKQGKAIKVKNINPDWAGKYRDDLWLAQETEILQKLQQFCQKKLKAYPDKRDYPAMPATSTLSPYLTLGRIGPRRLLHTIQYYCAEQNLHWQDNDWLRELAWRDFYRQLLIHFPELNKEKPFKPETENLVWNDSESAYKAWCDGNTGFPIVDAAMRQLNQTGWMHNRLRMIVASFLTKLLFIDWRQGEKYFMQTLIDGEFAANNGGWQWSASTGCDAAPYFRVFNPQRQSEKFDPDGEFIRRFVPELKSLSAKQIHSPTSAQRKEFGYPEPVVDYKKARQEAISAFDALK
ncbi:deoxyribodipyrimidine photo-lyase [Methylophaga thalassica]|uniref:Deoxyribodipyrimidine photo-lyase n=1 Tax=Methylophaga thalassica TaxID=40223 RepID=A0ABQ5TWV3_9GAMM|nr:deoxyribodipyrimidine photo-lyase [Methylophaga thalassica]WVI85144.1 deoxyribodipyrimidine photo-lyase [Methylophaga thalassica]GLQ00239.1 deoxyribodipyrimidine photo-lyase [Methylophaga thalassica]